MGRVVLHLPGGESEKPYVVGTYVGDGQSSKTISLGFTPSAVQVWPSNGKLSTVDSSSQFEGHGLWGGFALDGKPCGGSYVEVLFVIPGGFRVFYRNDNGYVKLSNVNGNEYYYIAFR